MVGAERARGDERAPTAPQRVGERPLELARLVAAPERSEPAVVLDPDVRAEPGRGRARASASRRDRAGEGAARVRSPRVSWRAVRRGVQVLAGVVVAAWLAAAPAAHAVDATIRRTTHGIPHIFVDDFAGLGYGYGYAFAQDNLCVLADTYVTVSGERSRSSGPTARGASGATGRRQQPQQRLLLPADHRQRHDRAAADAAAAARARARDQGAGARLRRRLQPLPARHRRRQPLRPDAAAASRGCGRSPRWTSTGASTSSACSPARASRSTASARRSRRPARSRRRTPGRAGRT